MTDNSALPPELSPPSRHKMDAGREEAIMDQLSMKATSSRRSAQWAAPLVAAVLVAVVAIAVQQAAGHRIQPAAPPSITPAGSPECVIYVQAGAEVEASAGASAVPVAISASAASAVPISDTVFVSVPCVPPSGDCTTWYTVERGTAFPSPGIPAPSGQPIPSGATGSPVAGGVTVSCETPATDCPVLPPPGAAGAPESANASRVPAVTGPPSSHRSDGIVVTGPPVPLPSDAVVSCSYQLSASPSR